MAFRQIDERVGKFYEARGINDYFDEHGTGKFMHFVEEQELEEAEVDEELEGVQNCQYLEFDPDFPFNKELRNANDAERNEFKFNLIKQSHRGGDAYDDIITVYGHIDNEPPQKAKISETDIVLDIPDPTEQRDDAIYDKSEQSKEDIISEIISMIIEDAIHHKKGRDGVIAESVSNLIEDDNDYKEKEVIAAKPRHSNALSNRYQDRVRLIRSADRMRSFPEIPRLRDIKRLSVHERGCSPECA